MCGVLHCLWKSQIPLISGQVHTRETDVRTAFKVRTIKEDIPSGCCRDAEQQETLVGEMWMLISPPTGSKSRAIISELTANTRKKEGVFQDNGDLCGYIQV